MGRKKASQVEAAAVALHVMSEQTGKGDRPVAVPTQWRPPGWREGDPDEPYTPEDQMIDGMLVPGVLTLYKEFEAAGYYTTGGTLTEKGLAAKDSQDAEDVLHNVKLLRDAWNTHERVWPLAQALVGPEHPFVVDPFHNNGTRGLPYLRVRLTGLTPQTDGLLVIGDDDDAQPANWRRLPDGSELPRGQAAAAVNGPHSFTERWLRLCQVYAKHDVVAAFVPDCGDAWFEQIALTADLVVRLGRVPCHAPPGIKASSPRGASAMPIWFPPSLDRKTLPKHTQDALKGKTFKVPLWTRPKKGIQYAYVQRGDVTKVVDLGLLGGGV